MESPHVQNCLKVVEFNQSSSFIIVGENKNILIRNNISKEITTDF
jgi:hypothetical protein